MDKTLTFIIVGTHYYNGDKVIAWFDGLSRQEAIDHVDRVRREEPEDWVGYDFYIAQVTNKLSHKWSVES
jgi:hypothetical protein